MLPIRTVILLPLVLIARQAFAGVNSPVGTPLPAAPGQTEVLIYVANESAAVGAEAENIRVLSRWLLASSASRGPRLARQYERDQRLFPAAVDAEVAQLRAAAAGPTGRRLGMLVATNRLARAGSVLVSTPDRPGLRPVRFVASLTDHYIRAANPLAIATNLAAVLRLAAEVFPPATHTFVLVTKSHGSRELALTTNISARHEDLSPDLLNASLNGTSVPGLTAALPERIGTTKAAYLDLLDQAGARSGMRFAMTYLDACKSGLGFAADARIPANVGLIYTTDGSGTGYQTLDYGRLLQAGGPLISALESELDRLRPPAPPRRLPIALLAAAPVVGLLGFIISRRKVTSG